MMTNIPRWITQMFPFLVWRGPDSSSKTLYLTFDDGPHPSTTPYLLSQLRDYEAKATFFCTGFNAERYPSLFQDIQDEGHRIGNHSYSHISGWRTSASSYLKDVERFQKLHPTSLFRPPYGRVTPYQFWKLWEKYQIVLWDVFPRDYAPDCDVTQCYDTVRQYAQSRSIIVFHENDKASDTLRKVIPLLLTEFSREGYVFGAL